MSDALVSEALNFLLSSKTTESLSAELASALYVPFTLEDKVKLETVIAEAVKNGRNVVVAGSAGGGKTMLVNQIISELKKQKVELNIVDESDLENFKIIKNHVSVVRDLTAVSSEIATQIIKSESGCFIIAANEGALMDKVFEGYFDSVIRDLHSLQTGNKPNDDSQPIVIDMASIDPLSNAIQTLLSNKILHQAVELFESQSGSRNAPRILALKQLRNNDVALAISQLITSTLGPGEVTFRELWNFIADLLLGGENDTTPPTSVWFWRLFKGETSISDLIAKSLKPEFLALPNESFALFTGDIEGLKLSKLSKDLWLHPGVIPMDVSNLEKRNNLITWLRIQYALIEQLASNKSKSIFVGSFSTELNDKVAKKYDKVSLIQALNGYFRRKEASENDSSILELWIHFMVERRQDRGFGLASLGSVSAGLLELNSSQSIANLNNVQLKGSRLFLQPVLEHKNSTNGLEINSNLFKAISRGRATSLSDRDNDDIDLAIKKFYFTISNVATLERHDVLNILSTPHEENAKEYSWKIGNLITKLSN
jgi:hypothetical protein